MNPIIFFWLIFIIPAIPGVLILEIYEKEKTQVTVLDMIRSILAACIPIVNIFFTIVTVAVTLKWTFYIIGAAILSPFFCILYWLENSEKFKKFREKVLFTIKK